MIQKKSIEMFKSTLAELEIKEQSSFLSMMELTTRTKRKFGTIG